MRKLVVVDPDAHDLSRPQSLRRMVEDDEGRTPYVLWVDEASSAAGDNYLRYYQHEASRVGARELNVSRLPKAAADAFYTRTHLQGACNAHIHYALMRGTEPYACMSFGSSSSCRSHPGLFLLQRFASWGAVPGAASRLLAAFRRDYSGPVRTFSDNRYADGSLYQVLGFSCSREYPPDYRYRKDGKWVAKNRLQKSRLRQLGAAPGTERQMAESLGYRRCYDLGKRVWDLPRQRAVLDR